MSVCTCTALKIGQKALDISPGKCVATPFAATLLWNPDDNRGISDLLHYQQKVTATNPVPAGVPKLM